MRLEIGDLTPPTFESNWSLPALRAVSPASLSDLLPSIVDFQEALFPRSRGTITRVNRMLAAEPTIHPSAATQEKKLWGSVALAVDRGVLGLHGCDVSSEMIETLLLRFGRRAAPIVSVLSLGSPSVPGNGTIDTAHVGWLYLLGCLEPVRRGFRPLSDIDTDDLPPHVTRSAARKWLDNLVPPDIADEIRAMLEVARTLQPDGPMFPNPIFGGLGPITGSDGDWIVGHTLVELKCTVRGVSRAHIVQLACYAALSRLPGFSGGVPHFERLALMLPRQSSIVVGTIEQWLGAFGAPPQLTTLTAITDDFASRTAAA
jgi:hypothetical protein